MWLERRESIVDIIMSLYMCTHTSSSLRESWERLKHETESSGRVHLTLAQSLLDEIHHTVKEFREQQRDIRKKVRHSV